MSTDNLESLPPIPAASRPGNESLRLLFPFALEAITADTEVFYRADPTPHELRRLPRSADSPLPDSVSIEYPVTRTADGESGPATDIRSAGVYEMKRFSAAQATGPVVVAETVELRMWRDETAQLPNRPSNEWSSLTLTELINRFGSFAESPDALGWLAGTMVNIRDKLGSDQVLTGAVSGMMVRCFYPMQRNGDRLEVRSDGMDVARALAAGFGPLSGDESASARYLKWCINDPLHKLLIDGDTSQVRGSSIVDNDAIVETVGIFDEAGLIDDAFWLNACVLAGGSVRTPEILPMLVGKLSGAEGSRVITAFREQRGLGAASVDMKLLAESYATKVLEQYLTNDSRNRAALQQRSALMGEARRRIQTNYSLDLLAARAAGGFDPNRPIYQGKAVVDPFVTARAFYAILGSSHNGDADAVAQQAAIDRNHAKVVELLLTAAK